MPDPDPYTCTQCGHTEWSLRFAPDHADLSVEPRGVIAIWCSLCEQPAPPAHPLWPRRAEAPAREGGVPWTRSSAS